MQNLQLGNELVLSYGKPAKMVFHPIYNFTRYLMQQLFYRTRILT